MKESELRQIPLTAMLAAVAVILPQFFHLLGLGATFLPMFLPIMLGSLLLTWKFALTLAILPPLVSFMMTGMPPIVPPLLPVMLSELIFVSQILSVLHKHLKKPMWLALLLAIAADRLLLYIIVSLIAPLLGFNHPLFSLALVSAGIPGIILQMTILPLTLRLIYQKFPQWKDEVDKEST